MLHIFINACQWLKAPFMANHDITQAACDKGHANKINVPSKALDEQKTPGHNALHCGLKNLRNKQACMLL